MKYIIIILILLAFTKADDFVVTKGVGSAKIIVGKTKLKIALSQLKNYKVYERSEIIESKKEVDGEYYITSGEVTMFDIVYYNQKKGIALQFTTLADQNERPIVNDHAVLQHLILTGYVHAKTTDNIILNISTIDEIIEKYGQWESKNTEQSILLRSQIRNLKINNETWYFIHYPLDGISFGVDSKTEKVVLIDIYPEEGKPYFR